MGRRSRASQALRRVVLPEPGGAERSVSFRSQGVFEALCQAWARDEMVARRRSGQLRAQQITECAI